MSKDWDDFIREARTVTADAGELAKGAPHTAKELLTVKTEHFSFEGLFIPARRNNGAGPKKIVVSLSAGGRREKSRPEDVPVLFHRWSWHRVFPDCDMLCVEDPMYKLHPNLITAWYYGDKDVCCLKELCEAIDAFRRAQGAETKDVLFLGSSAGGYAALFLCDLMKGSLCFAMNPQLIPPRWSEFGRVADALGLDPNAEDPFGRNDITRRLARNFESRFMIFCSIKSKGDFDRQVKPLFDSLYGVSYKETEEVPPVVVLQNFIFILAPGNYPLPHDLLIDPTEAAMLAGCLRERTTDPADFNFILSNGQKRWSSEQEFKCKQFWLANLQSARLKNCKFPEVGRVSCFIESTNGLFSVRIIVAIPRVGLRQAVSFYVTSKGAMSPAACADFLGNMPKIKECCKIAVRPGDVKLDANTDNMVPCLNEMIELFVLDIPKSEA